MIQQNTHKMSKSNAKAKAPNGGSAKKKSAAWVAAPVAMGRKGVLVPPARVSGNPYTPGGTMRIVHKEYIGEVLGSSAGFLNVKYPINPGLAATFPWLSRLAFDFEEYSFNKLHFLYEPEKPTSAAGYVMMAIDYDAADAVPSTKQQLAASLGAVRTPVWSNVSEIAAKKQLQKQSELYLRSGNLASNLDIKTYDLGFLNVAVGNCADGTFLGELWVEYDVTFAVPQLDIVGQIESASRFITSGGTVSETAIFGTAATYAGGLPVTATGSTLTFSVVGSYLVSMQVTGTTLIDGSPVFTGTATAAVQNAFFVNAAATVSIGVFSVVTTAIGQTVILDYSALSAATSQSLTWIAPWSI